MYLGMYLLILHSYHCINREFQVNALKNNVLVLECSHIYHFTCYEQWLRQDKKTCPVCRAESPPHEISLSSDRTVSTIITDVSIYGQRAILNLIFQAIVRGDGEFDPTITEPTFCPAQISIMQSINVTSKFEEAILERTLTESSTSVSNFRVSTEPSPVSAQPFDLHTELVSASLNVFVGSQASNNQASDNQAESSESRYGTTPDLSDANSNSPIIVRNFARVPTSSSSASSQELVLSEYDQFINSHEAQQR